MGSPDSETGRYSDETQHQVTLTKDYYIGVFEVTQKQWELVMGNNPSQFVSDTRPVERVSYYQVRENPNNTDDSTVNWPNNTNVNMNSFMGKMRSRTGFNTIDLPTEAQWEFACRATTTSAYAGNSILSDMGWYSDNSDSQTHPVGGKQPNAWGLYDMHGNVYEWCLDWNATYPGGPVSDPVGGYSSYRILRGGCWSDSYRFCRSAYRIGGNVSGTWDTGAGFRAAVTGSLFNPNLVPSLTYPTTSGYDGVRGVSPVSGVAGGTFTFRVVYKDGNGDAPASGYPRVVVRSNGVDRVYAMTADAGGTYTDGKSYTKALVLQAGSYGYRFEAQDANGAVATGGPVGQANGPLVNAANLTPSLEWSPATGYDGVRGVSPVSGVAGGTFTFRVVYKDGNGDAPASGYPRVVVRSNGVDRVYPMTAEAGGTYTDGKSYTKSLVLLAGSYGYRFEAQDANGAVATGSPVGQANGPLVNAANLTPSLEWSPATGYDSVRGVSPVSGVAGGTFTFRVVYKDGNGDAPASGYPRVVVRSNGVDTAYAMTAEAGGTYADGKSYTKALVLLAGSYGYRFEAQDVNGAVATGSPVGLANGPLVYEGVQVPQTPVLCMCTQGRDALGGAIKGIFRPVSGVESYEVFRSESAEGPGERISVTFGDNTQDSKFFKQEGLPKAIRDGSKSGLSQVGGIPTSALLLTVRPRSTCRPLRLRLSA
jgi:hypothetical protein